jgi:DNA-binding response OmpR family regulator
MTALTPVDRPRRVLIVGTFAEDRVVYTTFLRHHGIVARGVARPETALRVLDSFRPEAIVTNLVFSGRSFDGLAFISAVRQQHDVRQPVVVVVSDFTEVADQRRARLAGADSCLIKPCLPERLLLEVRRASYARQLMNVSYQKDRSW